MKHTKGPTFIKFSLTMNLDAQGRRTGDKPEAGSLYRLALAT
jgi:hypothetical protein